MGHKRSEPCRPRTEIGSSTPILRRDPSPTTTTTTTATMKAAAIVLSCLIATGAQTGVLAIEAGPRADFNYIHGRSKGNSGGSANAIAANPHHRVGGALRDV